ncbi:MAG: DUF504 domain-containing protein [Nitrosopumilus sp.]|nr:DUF504 domain-containing protein [Nitrosopumilus sp.]MDH3489606.1 DUF504 domain-containing protein [Nitrosopumilus sp.]MDH3516604.1 DUF504 domain-containing protein [Nitrosopumilus sp.]MDH3565071.1 DUF504 domain-containing protein [Nitrosopumilus sp.]MDH5416494.1 DUF504 domain-containing protein [Nitrosopumilus sp.]
MTKKGMIYEIFSKARFGNEVDTYKIFYRDFEKIIETTLLEFIRISENFETIPVGRIEKITKNNKILFEKNSKKETT